MRANIFRSLSVLFIATLACGGLTPGATSPAPSAATAAPTLAPTAPPPEPLTGLEQNLWERVEAGEWTLEQGLVASLKFLAQETTQAEINPHGRPIETFEGSGVVRVAAAYIKNGTDAATKVELQRLLDIIFPSQAKLDLYSRPAAEGGEGGARRARVSAQNVDCLALWRVGFPDPEPGAGPLQCFEQRPLVVGGHEIGAVYYPLEYLTDMVLAARMDDAVAAVQHAYPLFQGYRPMPLVAIVFTLLPDPEHPNWLAATLKGDEVLGVPTACHMAIYPSGADLSEDNFKQTVAHELFHCLQYQNYTAGLLWLGNLWWVEGTAEYFSNVAYPTVDFEYRFADDFGSASPTHSLIDLGYENFIFFQYLGNTVGDDGILRLLESIDILDGVEAQRRALAAYPDMANLFHNFARDYLDENILDSAADGHSVPSHLELAGREVRVVDGTEAVEVPAAPFVVRRVLLRFREQRRFTGIGQGLGGDLTSAAQLSGETGAWADDLPGELTAHCDPLDYLYLVTNATTDEGAIAAVVNAAAEEDERLCDRCLLGQWQLDNESYWEGVMAQFEAAQFSGVRRDELSGTTVLDFTGDGHLVIFVDNFSVGYTQAFGDGTATAALLANGVHESSWMTDGAGSLSIYDITAAPEFSFHMTVTRGGATFSTDEPPPGFSPLLPGNMLYQCSDDTLLIDPYSPAGGVSAYVTYDKLAPPPP